jgi:peptide/nickel transport system permease protein
MRITDIFLAFPALILTLVVVSVVGRHMLPIISTFGILGIPGYARLMRGIALQEINKPYVQSAIVGGSGNGRIIAKHILPNCIAPIIVSFTFDLGGIILSLAGLGFLGFGDPTLIEWGNDISIAQSQLYSAPWASFWPGMGILVTVLAFMLVGDGLRDALDPRLKI